MSMPASSLKESSPPSSSNKQARAPVRSPTFRAVASPLHGSPISGPLASPVQFFGSPPAVPHTPEWWPAQAPQVPGFGMMPQQQFWPGQASATWMLPAAAPEAAPYPGYHMPHDTLYSLP